MLFKTDNEELVLQAFWQTFMTKANEETSFPDYWAPMNPDETYITVDLKPDDPDKNIRDEYEWVCRSFMRDTGGRQPKILKVRRHQNKLTFT